MHLLFLILNVGVNEQRVGFTVDTFHCNLESIKESRLTLLARFSLTIPSDAAKNANTYEMNCFSFSLIVQHLEPNQSLWLEDLRLEVLKRKKAM